MLLTVLDKNNDAIELGHEAFLLDAAGTKLLAGFCANFDRAAKHSAFFRNAPCIKSFTMSVLDGCKVELSRNYSEADLFTALHVCRPLMLKNEVCSFQRTHDYLWRNAQTEVVKRFMAKTGDQFLNGEFSHYGNFWSNDQKLLCNKALETWLNAEHFHLNGDRAEKYAELSAGFGREMTEKMMIAQFSQRIYAMISLRYALDIPRCSDDSVRA